MLTGSEILKKINEHEIFISNFDKSRLNPNSYNLTLNENIKVYDLSNDEILDVKKAPKTKDIIIPEEGYVLMPGILYLASTNEVTRCDDLIPCIDGRSSIGRLGIFTHITAGFGDIGFRGTWTLEITVVHPVRIYKNMGICQIYFYEPTGSTIMKYHGKYQNQRATTESRIFKEYSKN